MKTKFLTTLAFSTAAAFIFAGCGGGGEKKPVPAQGNGMSIEKVQNNPDVKGKTPIVFQQPLARVNEAAARALVGVGCEVKRNEPYFASGRRPNKMGLFVGSGGETVKIFMLPQGDKVTNVWVDTDLSFVGIAGQQNWNKQVIAEMTSLLK